MKINKLSAEKIKTLEDYVLILLVGIASIKSMERYQEVAIKEGFLLQPESEYAYGIILELKRISQFFNHQLEDIMERTPVTTEEILKAVDNFLNS
jgi:hypothetical protein